MSGIHDEILKRVQTQLTADLVNAIDDDTKATLVRLGPLDGDPDPDVARIFITLHENDPEAMIGGTVTGLNSKWSDEPDTTESSWVITTKRRFTARARCLLEQTQEGLDDARTIASTVRTRLESSLQRVSFSGININGEYVSRPIVELHSEMLQGGGAPDSYDFHIKVRFEVLTTRI